MFGGSRKCSNALATVLLLRGDNRPIDHPSPAAVWIAGVQTVRAAGLPPRGRFGHCMVAAAGSLWVYGGWMQTHALGDLTRLDLCAGGPEKTLRCWSLGKDVPDHSIARRSGWESLVRLAGVTLPDESKPARAGRRSRAQIEETATRAAKVEAEVAHRRAQVDEDSEVEDSSDEEATAREVTRRWAVLDREAGQEFEVLEELRQIRASMGLGSAAARRGTASAARSAAASLAAGTGGMASMADMVGPASRASMAKVQSAMRMAAAMREANLSGGRRVRGLAELGGPDEEVCVCS